MFTTCQCVLVCVTMCCLSCRCVGCCVVVTRFKKKDQNEICNFKKKQKSRERIFISITVFINSKKLKTALNYEFYRFNLFENKICTTHFCNRFGRDGMTALGRAVCCRSSREWRSPCIGRRQDLECSRSLNNILVDCDWSGRSRGVSAERCTSLLLHVSASENEFVNSGAQVASFASFFFSVESLGLRVSVWSWTQKRRRHTFVKERGGSLS